MSFLRHGGLAFLLAAGLVLGACDSGDTVTPTTPTEPTTTPVSVTDTFSGKLEISGSSEHKFSVGKGTVVTTLTTVGFSSTVALGLGVGTWDGTTCTLVIQSETAVQSSYMIGTATATVDLCVKIWDVGNLTDSSTYELTVVHY